MKKIISSILIVTLCIFMVGCKNNKTNSFEISLYSNGSTGYSWSEELSEEGIVEISSRYDDSNCPKDVVGCGGQEIYTVKALKPGTVTLTLTYAFVNKETNKDTKTAIYEITVDNNLNITEKHYGTYFEEE